MKSICYLGPLHGQEFHYSGSNTVIHHTSGAYHLTTEVDAMGRNRWKWQPPLLIENQYSKIHP